MTNEEFISAMESSSQTKCGGEVHLKMHELSQEALRITSQINGKYNPPDELGRLMQQLIGQKLDEKFGQHNAGAAGRRGAGSGK